MRRPRAGGAALPWLLRLCTPPLLCTVLSCEAPAAPPFEVALVVSADEGEPVAGARLWVAGEAAGASNDDGRLVVALRGREGDRLALRLECPPGYVAEPEQSLLILRRVRPLKGREPGPVSQALRCAPSQRAAVVLVRVQGAERIPVAIDGTPVAETDAHGFAHLHVQRDPGARLEVTLDTSARRELMPQSPRRTFEIADREALFVFDQRFKHERPRLTPRKAPALPPIPTRLQ
jgi:hypothetical protein